MFDIDVLLSIDSAATVMSLFYLAFALIRVATFRRSAVAADFQPAMTVLKPISGVEPRLFENLVSFCEQDYPEYQIVFGVVCEDDPAIAVIQRVVASFPQRDLVLVCAPPIAASNPKIANLANMLSVAKHELLVMADSDIHVSPQYLNNIAAPFHDLEVAGATCLYQGVPEPGLASALGAMFINEGFTPSVLVALTFQHLRFCFGATMAVRKSALLEIGGFRALADYLADDHMLGKLLSERGYKIALVPNFIETIVHEPNLSSLVAHELRWARTVRTLQPIGYTFSFLVHPIALSLTYLLIAPRLFWGLTALFIWAALRILLHCAARARFRTPGCAVPWLIPLRDVLSFAVWVAGLFGRTVRWRGRDFVIDAGGRLTLKEGA